MFHHGNQLTLHLHRIHSQLKECEYFHIPLKQVFLLGAFSSAIQDSNPFI
jgi:hypothetical protein